MLCDECGGTMFVRNTNSDPEQMETARMYVCSNCKKKIYTMEKVCSKNTACYLILQRYRRYYTEVRKE